MVVAVVVVMEVVVVVMRVTRCLAKQPALAAQHKQSHGGAWGAEGQGAATVWAKGNREFGCLKKVRPLNSHPFQTSKLTIALCPDSCCMQLCDAGVEVRREGSSVRKLDGQHARRGGAWAAPPC